jgi:adenylate kinase
VSSRVLEEDVAISMGLLRKQEEIMKIILIGIQGSGKSTQGNLLALELGISYLATGQIFRQLAQEDTELGKYIKDTMNAGYLIPDEKTIEIITQYLSRPEYEKGYILDGFPRTLKQAEAFANGVDYVVYYEVSDAEALRRISLRNSGRADDNTAAIQRRIELFHQFTKPVIEFYRSQQKLIEVDGEQSIEQIFADTKKLLPHHD